MFELIQILRDARRFGVLPAMLGIDLLGKSVTEEAEQKTGKQYGYGSSMTHLFSPLPTFKNRQRVPADPNL
jgi:hypothetical protein